jgi:predicted outer membrane repeat protein
MHRFLIALLLCLGLGSLASTADAQWVKVVSGYLPAGQTMVLSPRDFNNSANDTIYQISGSFNISGTLIVREGAEVQFLPNSRVVDSTGGKIIANGCSGLNRRILFRGMPVNASSVEWGHFLILPGADSVYFANVRFVNFMKRTTVDNSLIYGASGTPGTYSIAINNAANGVGGVLATFSRKTFIYDAIVDSCQASYRGGAFAFLQAPAASYFPGDDGRQALVNSQVRRLIIRDTRANNIEGASSDPLTLGGAIYMASANQGISTPDFVVAHLGGQFGQSGQCFPADTDDYVIIERCFARNPNAGAATYAKGGAIYAGSNTGLVLTRGTFNSNSAISGAGDLHAWGGAIAVSASSGNAGFTVPSTVAGKTYDQLAGLVIYKLSTFSANTAGVGGAIHMDYTSGSSINPLLYINGENRNLSTGVRDSGLILFTGNVAYRYGGAIYTNWNMVQNGYLAPQDFPWPGGSTPVELRIKYMNNVAGAAGGAVCLSTGLDSMVAPNSNPDITSHRVWYLDNSVNPYDARINRSWLSSRVYGGGAEWVGLRDYTEATEYHGNFTINGNGGAVAIQEAQGSLFAIAATNRYFVEDGYNASNVKLTPMPFDPRQLTRFCDNSASFASGDSIVSLYQYSGHGTGKGRGGAIWLNVTNTTNVNLTNDSTFLSRVRIENNNAFTGSAIYSDNFGMRMLSNLTLIANNHATSGFSATVDTIAGQSNPSDPNAGATIWADLEGALPSYENNSRGNAIYDNMARYILRLPVSPTIGVSGTDTLRGNFWGETGPNVVTQINPPFGALQQTFFIDYYSGCLKLSDPANNQPGIFEPNRNPPAGNLPISVGRVVPDTLLMEGRVYDLFDRGTDMKVADYSARRMAPAEAMSLGLPNDVARIHRFTRDIFTTDPTYVSKILQMQTDFVGPHPIGYPLFLQADVSAQDSNRDNCAKNYTVLMVFNQSTSEFVRVNAKETVVDEGNGPIQLYRGRLDFVPDSSIATRHPVSRQRALYTLSLLRPDFTMTGAALFDEIQRASKLEDSAALAGRAYLLGPGQMNGITAGDTVCTQGINGTSQWFAGERYHTLPVRPGDRILVISRTHLWKYGAAYAINNGLQFTIGDVLPPQFTADIPTLQSDVNFPNRRFVHEDVTYDGATPATTLFRVAGFDINNFYDPRYLFDPNNYTQLAFKVSIDAPLGPNYSRLGHWMTDTTIFNQNITGSNGYVLLRGTPHNPDVVPGGEGVTATVTNFVPNFASESGLLGAFDGSILGPDSNHLSMWVFPPYMNCPTGFLADTLCVHSTSTTYHFKIYVMDSLPLFTSSPSGACAANLTDSLRYTYDIQTDDESEDSVAQTEGWGFPYGRTSYRFLSLPSWMQTAANDPGFITNGILNVRVDSATAQRMLTPTPQINGELNLDTIVAVEAHDGHTGKAVQRWKLPVNVAPTITTATLPNAREGLDYSSFFNDTTNINRILINDPNYGDYHTYQILYDGDTMTVYRDAKYGVGATFLTGHTPRWLKIDPFSGVLTGIPGINDAPRIAGGGCGDSAMIDVIVTDQCGLMAWKTLRLQVDSVQHLPAFYRGPHSLCVTNKIPFCDTIQVTDLDLTRNAPCNEQLNISVLEPAGFTVTPATVTGTIDPDTAKLTLCGSFNEDDSYFTTNPPPPKTIRLLVTDRAGNTDTLTYTVHIGDIPTFECAIDVSNLATSTHPTDIQHLCFGAGRFGTDSIDARYCEFEVPPQPPSAVFDARWELPIGGQVKGTYIDIRRDTNQFANMTWQVRIQAGNESGSFLYPIQICWKSSCFDSTTGNFQKGNFYLRHPQTPSQFDINMRTGLGPVNNSLFTLKRVGTDMYCLEIRDVNLRNAIIVFQPEKSAVGNDAPQASNFAIEQNTPNPFNPIAGATTINFTVAKRSAVRVDIFDMKGAFVRTLVNEELEQGSYPVTWDATDENGQEVSSGTYIAKMTAADFTASIKMTITK